MTITRDELYNLIADHVTVSDGLGYENGQAFYEPYVDGIGEATDAIMARLELDNKIALSRETVELLDLLGVVVL